MDAYAASALMGHSPQGQTLPLYLACRVGQRTIVYQAKLAGERSGLSPRELGVEMLGTTIAHSIGLHVARPATVTLTRNVREAIEREYQFGIEDPTAFGALWKAELTPFVPEVEVERLDEKECAALLALDLLLNNGDRTEPNPNVCWEGERLLIFDFEHCLELPRLDYERRLALHLEVLRPTYATHLVARRVGRAALRAAAANVLSRLAVEGLRRDAFALSRAWHEEWVDNVEYLGYIQRESATFLDCVESLVP